MQSLVYQSDQVSTKSQQIALTRLQTSRAPTVVQVYWKRAEQLEREKDYPGAIADFEQVRRQYVTFLLLEWLPLPARSVQLPFDTLFHLIL